MLVLVLFPHVAERMAGRESKRPAQPMPAGPASVSRDCSHRGLVETVIIRIGETKPLDPVRLTFAKTGCHPNASLANQGRVSEVDRSNFDCLPPRNDFSQFARPQKPTAQRVFQKRRDGVARAVRIGRRRFARPKKDQRIGKRTNQYSTGPQTGRRSVQKIR